ncbi:formylglycine-generating enzyme family protein [Stieleria sp. JC731]|uniref:formylglycine-generating enzyme family protein n=1 Tax=Pirellulaceae TaxID=2691357 RepID=UPI001E2A93EA|nr:formylglycine-generating enzyme family protein [Stieleria sp. JC731]MCC9601920.1 formylglycine-generating enzyme family protein [Stieleria sp. JC731]
MLRLLDAEESGRLTASLDSVAEYCGFDIALKPIQVKDSEILMGCGGTSKVSASAPPPKPTEVPPLEFLLPVFAAAFEPDLPREASGKAISARALALPKVQSPNKTPLVPWSRLGAFVRSSLTDECHGHRLDITRLIRMVANGEPIVDVPRLSQPSLNAPAVVLLDYSEEMMPFRDDLHHLERHIKFEFGLRVDIRWIRDIPGRQLLRSLPSKCRLLVVSAMGQLRADPFAIHAWTRFGDQLIRDGHFGSALVPCPQQRWSTAIAKQWRCAVWDHFAKMPRRDGLRSQPAPQHDSGSDWLLDLVSPAALVEPGLLRAVRFLCGKSADVGAEFDAFFHPACNASLLWFSIDNEETLERLVKLRAHIRSGRVDEDFECQLMKLIANYHRTCSDPVSMDAWSRAEFVSSWARANPWVDTETDHLVAERLRELAANPGGKDPTGLVKHWISRIDRVPTDQRRKAIYAKGTARAYFAAQLTDEEVVWPDGIDADEANRELQRLIDLPEQTIQLRVSLADGRMEIQQSQAGSSAAGNFPATIVRARRKQIGVAIDNVNRTILLKDDHAASICDLSPVPQTLTVVTDTEGVHFCKVQRPAWATRFGHDRYGIYATVEIESIELRLRWIPPGQFIMGDGEFGPQQEVLISQGFWMSATLTTQNLWQTVVAKHGDSDRNLPSNPSHFRGDNLPVESIAWDDAMRFCELISQSVSGLTFSLPTEAQWEFACRGDSTTAFYFGDGEDGLEKHAWFDRNSEERTHEVGSKLPNAFGLYDLYGNVLEWCFDGKRDYQDHLIADPLGPLREGVYRVVRGGGWFYSARFCRSAFRFAIDPGSRNSVLGFRLVAGQPVTSTESSHRGAVVGLWSGDAVAERPLRFLARKQTTKPDWATRVWEDEYGFLAEFEINGVEFQFRKIPHGSFQMGSPESEDGRDSDEGPVHRVTISQDFWIATTPTTQRQWTVIAEANPSHFNGERRPVEQVSWEDAQNWIERLKKSVPGLPARLPTEAEWEYACRAGTTTRFASGQSQQALSGVAWFEENSGDESHDVAMKAANPWGIWDMHGNVYEWCLDGLREFENQGVVDPVGPLDGGVNRVVRGGSWIISARDCRSAYRDAIAPGVRVSDLGFRLVAGQFLSGPEGQNNQTSGGAG